MSITLGIIIISEVILTLFTVWGIMNEDKLIRFERKLAALIKARINYSRRRAAAAQHRRINAKVIYTPVPAAKSSNGSRAA